MQAVMVTPLIAADESTEQLAMEHWLICHGCLPVSIVGQGEVMVSDVSGRETWAKDNGKLNLKRCVCLGFSSSTIFS